MSHWKTKYLSKIKGLRSLSRGTEFIDRIDALTERKMNSMRSRSVRKSRIRSMEDIMHDLMDVRNERQKRIGAEGNINKVDAIT